MSEEARDGIASKQIQCFSILYVIRTKLLNKLKEELIEETHRFMICIITVLEHMLRLTLRLVEH